MIIDTHTHLDFEQYDDDRELVIQRALENNISAMITIGTDVKTSEKAIHLADKYAPVFAAVGIHPTDCQDVSKKDVKIIEEMMNHDTVVAVGEIGLDYYHMRADKKKQIDIFSMQVALAHQYGYPVIIHNREAHDDMMLLIKKLKIGQSGGVMHSFSGDMSYLRFILESDLFISFTGNITFKKAKGLDLVLQTPLERMLLETDSPFLTPAPLRGKRNEPSYLSHTAQKIAELKNIPFEKVVDVTTSNARKLFKLPI